MTASLTLVVVAAVLFGAGIAVMLERSLTRVLIGFLLVGNGVNLFMFTMGSEPGLAPILVDGIDPAELADPLPQALAGVALQVQDAIQRRQPAGIGVIQRQVQQRLLVGEAVVGRRPVDAGWRYDRGAFLDVVTLDEPLRRVAEVGEKALHLRHGEVPVARPPDVVEHAGEQRC